MKKQGVGIACCAYGVGNTAAANPAAAFLEVLPDGQVQVLAGAADIGQGSSTVLCQVAAEVLGVPPEQVSVISADTAVTPEGGATSASRQTYISGNAVRLAAESARAVMARVAAGALNVRPEMLRFAGGMVSCAGQPEKAISFPELARRCRAEGEIPLGSGSFSPATTSLDPATGQGVAYSTYSFGAQVARVEVDTETGEVKVLGLWSAFDLGRAVNPLAAEGQLEGGAVMGLGQALLEEVLLERGRTLTDSWSTYLLPTILDAPEVEGFLVEDPEPTGPFGAKGVGEPALVPTAAAIANAVADAIGVPVTELPITPERVLAALRRAGE